MQFLVGWAKKLSWQETAKSFKSTWNRVFHSIEHVVDYGLKHRDVSEVKSIHVDEVAIQKGHKYLTLVYQIDKKDICLLWAGKGRKVKTLLRFFS